MTLYALVKIEGAAPRTTGEEITGAIERHLAKSGQSAYSVEVEIDSPTISAMLELAEATRALTIEVDARRSEG